MAGSPKKRAMVAALEQRTRETFPDEADSSHLDYLADWLGSGKTLRALCRELDVSPPMVYGYLNSAFEASAVRETFSRAREIGAHQLAEETLDIADAANKDTAMQANLQVRARQWVAERWNPRDLGSKGGATINVSIGALMLDALRQPAPLRSPDAIPRAIAEEAEVLSIEESSACDAE